MERRGRGKIMGHQEHKPLFEGYRGGCLQQTSTEGRVITRQRR
jgi:hypothetical protein